MKKVLIGFIEIICISLMVIWVSCKNKITKQVFTPISEQEIYDVINAVVKQERLDTINFNKQRPLRVIDSLEFNRVYFLKPTKFEDGKMITIPPPPGGIDYRELISNKTKCFVSNDSAFFVYQNNHRNSLVLKPNKFSVIKITNWKNYHLNIDKDTTYSILTLSVPVFSTDHNKAYIQSGFHCGGLCGGGEEFFLIKINGKWLVKYKCYTWRA